MYSKIVDLSQPVKVTDNNQATSLPQLSIFRALRFHKVLLYRGRALTYKRAK